MRKLAFSSFILVGAAVSVDVAISGCGSVAENTTFDAGADGTVHPIVQDGSIIPPTSFDATGPILTPDAAKPKPTPSPDGGCQGYQCDVSTCSNDGGTTITGRVLDPAGNNPLANILAFVPLFDPTSSQSTIEPIAGGVTFPAGVTCDSCNYLISGNPIAVATTGADGTFTIPNAPSGANIPVVVQVGKWRTHTTVSTVTSCVPNAAGDIKLPSAGVPSDPIVSIPQIAISMGKADSLECLLPRIGIAASEFVVGAGGTGHIHLYVGGSGTSGSFPTSSTTLWDSLDHLNQYDVTLFSCEGADTSNANPPLLEEYVNNGGRVFASHYHYAWLSGALKGGTYPATPDWGTNLAQWNEASDNQGASISGKLVTTLNDGSGGTFTKGVQLQQWLQNVGALNSSGELPIVGPAYNASVTSANPKVQPWITDDTTPAQSFPTAYLSFDAPIDAGPLPDGGPPPYCGRVVFADLHVGDAEKSDKKAGNPATAGDCTSGALSAQEKALEFMLFDLSSCVTPDTAPPWKPPPPYEAGVPQ